jgi:hypothetical protein
VRTGSKTERRVIVHLKKTAFTVGWLMLAALLLACTGDSASVSETATEPIVYLKNNIHGTERTSGTTRTLRASYANYIGDYPNHAFIPVNTAVRITRVKSNGIYMTGVADGTEITFEYNPRNMPGLSAEEYVGYITSPNRISVSGLSRIDQKGIADGQAYVGMSKKGVRIALGYPALHKTPSLKDNTWTYWRNRFATIAVEFDAGGKVRSIR